jgi:uncharacterized GH25 family protein
VILHRLAACAAALLVAYSAQAHDFWIEPSAFKRQPGSIVAVHLWVGQDFVGDPVPRQSNSIEQFFVRQGGTEAAIGGANNIDPAGQFRRDGEGTAVIGYSSNGSAAELPAGKFEDYLRQYGLDDIVAERSRRGETTKPGKERFYRYAKALLTGTAKSDTTTQALGFAYEIVPGDDPTITTGPLRGRILYDSKPLAGALVEALWRDDPSIRLSIRSDAQGGFVFVLPRPGVWLIKSVHMVRAGFFASDDWESLWASLNFRNALAMTWIAQFTLLLCLLLPHDASAHEIGTSNVRFTLHTNQTWSAAITTAPTALANKIGPQAGQPRVSTLDADIVRARLAAATQLLAAYVEVRFDGAVSPAHVSVSHIEMPNNDILPDVVVLQAVGAIPPGAKNSSWRFGLIYATYAVVFTDEHGGRPVTQWLDGDAESKPFPITANAAPATRLEIVAQYVKLGFSHIVPEGLDHILFVLGLFLLTPRLKPILVQVTAFTAAHSVTLGLTMYGVLSLPSRIVEPLIALSIAYVAIENLMTPRLTPWRPLVVFGFGLVHGMGFAGALAELNLPHTEIIPALISFNVGIELAQLTVIAAAYFTVAFWLSDKVWYRARIVMPACATIAATGLFWTIQRILEA